MKKTLLYISVCLAVILAVIVLYFIFSTSKSLINTGPTKTEQNKTANQELKLISATPQIQAQQVPLNTPISAVFNKNISVSNISFSPPTTYTDNVSKNKLSIQPSGPLLASMKYVITIQIDGQLFFLTFTTLGPAPTVGQNTRPIIQANQDNTTLKDSNPDVYLSNYTPYKDADFAVSSNFVAGVPSHFQFTVVSKNGSIYAKGFFENWAKQNGLNADQISQLDVVYK